MTEMKLNYHFYDSLNDRKKEKILKYLKNQDLLGLDIETTRKYNKYGKIEGLDPYTSEIVMFQIGNLEHQFIFDTRVVSISFLEEILCSPTIQLVGHNLKFEYKHILHNYGIRINNLYDTMIAEKVLYSGYKLNNGLKDLNRRYLDITVDKGTRLEFLSIKDKKFTKRQLKYGAEDIFYPLLIQKKQLKKIKEDNISKTIHLEMKFIEVLGDIEYKGLNIDKERWLKLYNKNLKEFKKAITNLDLFVINNYFNSNFVYKQYNMFEKGFDCTIKWTSSKQVIDFFVYLGICPKEVSKTTKKLSYTVNAKVVNASLNTINKDIPDKLKELIKKYLEFKELEQCITTFGKKFLNHVNPITNRLHSNYNQILNTGRISSSGPNLQNIPSDPEFRKCFRADYGNKIVNSDYSGQENICLANVSLDPDILAFYESGESDMHSYNAKKIFPELKNLTLAEIAKNYPDLREIAKSVSFALAYGGNGYTIANNLGISEERGEEIYQSYFKAFPKLKQFFDKTIKKSMERGYIIIDEVTNRKFYFKDFNKLQQYKIDQDWSKYYGTKGKYERACLNYTIQGAAGSITKLAAIYFRKWILNNKLENKVFITNLVHDEINVECKEEISKKVAKYLEKAMFNAGAIWCKTVPLNSKAAIVDYWTH
jgi:DNA polymerase-1